MQPLLKLPIRPTSVVFLMMSAILLPTSALPQAAEPISAVGHGGFFDAKGQQIRVTQEFVEQAQSWYHTDMISALDDNARREFAEFERQFTRGSSVTGQAKLVARQY